MLLDEEYLPAEDSRRRWCKDLWLSTHSFGRGGAQDKFYHEDPSKCWSLSFLKFWCGWSESDSKNIIMGYLLDDVHSMELQVRADARAPDRLRNGGGWLEHMKWYHYPDRSPHVLVPCINTEDTIVQIITDFNNAVCREGEDCLNIRDMVKRSREY